MLASFPENIDMNKRGWICTTPVYSGAFTDGEISMKFNKRFLFIGLFLSVSLSAQNVRSALNITNTLSDTHNFEMLVTVDLSNTVQNGFFIQLPAGVLSTPVSVSIKSGPLWLKEAKTAPKKTGMVHWSRQKDGLLFLFTAETLVSGEIQLQFQSFISGKTTNAARIELKEIQPQAGQGFTTAALIGSKRLFQTIK